MMELRNQASGRRIKRGFETAYLHHIQRLMVVGNYMSLRRLNRWRD